MSTLHTHLPRSLEELCEGQFPLLPAGGLRVALRGPCLVSLRCSPWAMLSSGETRAPLHPAF